MSKRWPYVLGLGLVGLVSSFVFAAAQSFVPGEVFKGSELTGWHRLGAAEWSAENGEIVGTPKQGSGGWLVLDHGYQDVEFSASFRCSGSCKTGVLLRGSKAGDGINGIYVTLSDGDISVRTTWPSTGRVARSNA